MKQPDRLTLATRTSPLAMRQTEYVRAQLLQLYPFCQIEILGIMTEGDQRLEKPLAEFGGKGVFIKALEHALSDGRADLAVHSLKDLPSVLPPAYRIAAMTQRVDPWDAFVSNHYQKLSDLPYGAVIGTSSVRRSAQLKRLRPDIVIQPLRGNIGSRLQKLDDGMFDGLILASAGLTRLGWSERIRERLSQQQMLPAIGQGVLAIECLSERPDIAAILSPLNDPISRACVTAERAAGRILEGNCHLPLAAFAQCQGETLVLMLRLIALDGTCLETCVSGHWRFADELGQRAAQILRDQGAEAILADWRHHSSCGT